MNNEKYCEYLAYLAEKSVLYEVTTTPKPGLVDRNNSGAHNDMDFFTFMASSSALASSFYNFALEGVNYNGGNLEELLRKSKRVGIEAEKKMFNATKGINTHKGMIFSIGCVCVVAANIYRFNGNKFIKAEYICDKIAEMTKGMCEKEFIKLDEKNKLTNGEKLFKKYNLKGIRGEVESGFKTIKNFVLPQLKSLLNKNISINDICIQILLTIMAVSEDTNIVSRHDLSTLNYVQQYAKNILKMGGVLTEDGKREIKKMDKKFIEKNISPGGSADLLAVTLMLTMIEGSDII